MAKKKKEDIKKKDIKKVSKVELAKIARAKRMAVSGISKEQVKENAKEDFRKYFIQIKRKLNLKSDLENVLWSHFESAGFDSKDKFDDGITHFGLKL